MKHIIVNNRAMKRILILSALLLFFAGSFSSCKKEERYYIIDDGNIRKCEYIVYRAKIGNDLETALDSLEKSGAFLTNGREYYLKTEIITVAFYKDDRTFYDILLMDARFPSELSYEHCLFSPGVLDSKGNHYGRIHDCPD